MINRRLAQRLPGLIGLAFVVLALTAAMLTWAQAQSSVSVSKSANPSSVPEPGGPVTFAVRVTNSSAVDTVYITSLTDTVHGNLNGQGTCRVWWTLRPGQTYVCQFEASVVGNAGYTETNTVTASGFGNGGAQFSVSDDATVLITDVASSIRVTKTAA